MSSISHFNINMYFCLLYKFHMRKTIHLKDKYFTPLIPYEDIKQAIARVADEIKRDLDDKNPLLVGVLNGSFMFVASLMEELDAEYEVTFAAYSSYKGVRSTGSIAEIMPIQIDFKGRTVLLLEDIVDSGLTMNFLMNKLREEGAADVRLATMLLKPEALKCDLTPDYIGLSIPNDFIVGYGLDYDGLGRGLKDIYKVVE